uniref:Radial spoke head 1 n=1 Tax=Timema cristinae TaxID=61476 RepID=A0A7R9GYF3_TIMCR|nr:unnamed protein product [Timema cristinae]
MSAYLDAGEWKRDMRHGYGAYHYPNGDVYEGSWRKNLRHGLGNYTYQSSGTKFMGSWVDERMEGRGQLIHPKHRYHGTWGKNLVREGPGVYTFSLKWMQLGQYVHMKVSDQDLAEALDEERAEESTKDPSAIPLGVVALWRATKVGKYDPSLLPAEPVPVTITDSVQSIESVELPEEAGVKEEEAGESQEEPQAPEQAVQDKSPEEAEQLASQEIQEGIQPEPEVSAEDYPDTEDEDF